MQAHLSEEDLRSIRERSSNATPGPWCLAGSPRDFVIARHGGSERCSDNPVLWAEDDCLGGRREDADFVAHARADVPGLVEEVEFLRQTLRRVLVWQLGSSFTSGVMAECPDRDLAEEIRELFQAEGVQG